MSLHTLIGVGALLMVRLNRCMPAYGRFVREERSGCLDSSLHRADPAVIVPIGRAGEVHVGHQIQATLFQGLRQLSECFCLDSHFAYLVRLTAFIILDREGNSLIQIFYSGD